MSIKQATSVVYENDGQRIMAWARCRICNRVNNVCFFAEYEGEGILKYGLCIECKKKQGSKKADECDT